MYVSLSLCESRVNRLSDQTQSLSTDKRTDVTLLLRETLIHYETVYTMNGYYTYCTNLYNERGAL